MEAGFAQRVEQLGDGVTSEQLQRMQSAAEQHYETLRQLSESRGIPLSTVARRDTELGGASDSAQLEQAVTAAAALASADAALYATARLSFEGGICDVANRHAAEWVAELQTASELLPVAVIHELVGEGEECRCICPACGIGACLCMRNSIETVRTQWGSAGGEHLRDRRSPLIRIDRQRCGCNTGRSGALGSHPYDQGPMR